MKKVGTRNLGTKPNSKNCEHCGADLFSSQKRFCRASDCQEAYKLVFNHREKLRERDAREKRGVVSDDRHTNCTRCGTALSGGEQARRGSCVPKYNAEQFASKILWGIENEPTSHDMEDMDKYQES